MPRRVLPLLLALAAVRAAGDPIESYAFGDALETNRIPTVASVESALAGKAPRSEIPSLPLSVANGGTGATTAPDARASLGVVSKAGDEMTGNLSFAGQTGVQFEAIRLYQNGDVLRVHNFRTEYESELIPDGARFATLNDIPAIAAPSTDASAQGKAADAKATGAELASKASQADVAAAVAALGADAAATAAWRIVLADHQRRLDAIEDADGTDALTEAQAEELIRSRVETAIATFEDEWGDYSGCLPVQTQGTVSTAISEDASGISPSLSTLRAMRYYASGGSRSLGFASFSGVGNNPCLLILEGFSAVTWPSGARVSGAYSSVAAANVYEIYRLNDVLYARRVYP